MKQPYIVSLNSFFGTFIFYWIRLMNDMNLLFGKVLCFGRLACFDNLVLFLLSAVVFSENSLTRSAILSFKANLFLECFMYLS